MLSISSSRVAVVVQEQAMGKVEWALAALAVIVHLLRVNHLAAVLGLNPFWL